MLRSLKDLQNYSIQASGEDVGKLKDVYFDDHAWIVRYVVVDTGGWLRGRQVLVSPVALAEADWVNRRWRVDLTREQIEESPSIEENLPVSRQQEQELARYYHWPEYWGMHLMYPSQPPVLVTSPTAGEQRPSGTDDEDVRPVERRGDPTLRSLDEVTGYGIEAADGSIGRVEDLIGDDETWEVRYLVIDTRKWLPGKRVLVAINWVERIDWGNATVRVDLQKDTIKESPAFDPTEPLNRKYEEQLYDFYGRPYYWS